MYWIDIDNTPHVPLFVPIIQELKNRNYTYIITARDFAQTKELLNNYSINYNLIGKHSGKNKVRKVINLFHRSILLRSFLKDKAIDLAISHGSRTQLLTTKYLNIKSILMLDYEHTESKIFNLLSTKLLIPMHIPDKILKDLGFELKKIIRYNGFKEELYLNNFKPELNFRKNLGINDDEILVVIRPPSMTANYHDTKSEVLFLSALNYFSKFYNVICVIVNRTEIEKKFIEKNFNINGNKNIRFLEKAVNGLQLLYSADIAISGGGTMNREAALLGTETYSIFTGRRPYLDEYLEKLGRLKFIEKPDDYKKIKVERKEKNNLYPFNSNLVKEITEIFINETKLTY